MKRSKCLSRKFLSLLCCLALTLGLLPSVAALAADTPLNITGAKQTYYIKAVTGDQPMLQEVEVTFQNTGAAFQGFARATVTANISAKPNPQGAETASSYTGAINVPEGGGKGTVLVPDTNAMLTPGNTATLVLELFDNQACEGTALAAYTNTDWQRTRHWEFYLSQTMHTDIGYTNYQEDLRPLFTGFLETVKQYMQNSDERETDVQKYKYAIESGWVMGEGYMSQTNAEQIEEILNLIESDRMMIGAGQFNYTMENFSTEALARASYYTNRYLVDRLGIDPSTTERMFDNPSFTKSYVDVANSAGIKYGIHSMNPDRSPYHQKKLYDLFYMDGNVEGGKLLIFNGKTYGENYGFGGSHGSGSAGSAAEALSYLTSIMNDLESRTGRRVYPYDKFPLPLIPYGDNKHPDDEQVQVGNEINRQMEAGGYAYPHVKMAFPDEFFADVEREYGDLIPHETGTEENWWNDGWGTTAYESGISKLAGDVIPAAETAASLAASVAGAAYPHDDLAEAMQRNLIYDEHTWGWMGYDNTNNYHSMWEWKRSNAFGAKTLADRALQDSVNALAGERVAEGDGKVLYAYNGLNWVRSDAVSVALPEDFPATFKIMDGEQSVPYTVEDGVLRFVAEDVPAMGYKTFRVEETGSAPTFTPVTINEKDMTMENEFYKVTFAQDGTIASILDKQSENRELVDQAAAEKFNQYRYYDDHGVPFSNMGASFDESNWTLYTPEAGEITVESDGVKATARVNTSTFRAPSITQTVTLYQGLPRIDIVNEVVKGALPSLQSKEEGFYTFPFKTANAGEDGHIIRYDLPLGNVAEGEQVFGTSHDWYTVSKWTGVQDTADGYNMVLASPNTALMQFGERRTGNWSFDYVSENPYLYSYVFNNMWQTNFQGDQPGYADFRYSISTNKNGADMSGNNRFGWEISNPIQATVTDGAQAEATKGSYLSISKENVQLTTMKPAESNGEGMILRFAEIAGRAAAGVTVTLPAGATIVETDIIENDLEHAAPITGTEFAFDLPAYGFKTFRVIYTGATKPAKIANVQAVTAQADGANSNLVLASTVEASSFHSEGYKPEYAKSIGDGQEWASNGQKNAWIEFKWDKAQTIGILRIADRPNEDDNIAKALLTFSDGTKIEVTDIPTSGATKEIVLDTPVTATSVKVELTGSASTKNVGLKGFEAYIPNAVVAGLKGTAITWDAVSGAQYYQVFRSAEEEFTPGSGNFLGDTDRPSYYDGQVTDGLSKTYYYAVRAVGVDGAAGLCSDNTAQSMGDLTDRKNPGKPELTGIVREKNRIDLWWTPVFDNLAVDHYELYRDGELLTQRVSDNYVVNFRDYGVEEGQTYEYKVTAVDAFGNKTDSDAFAITTPDYSTVRLTSLTFSQEETGAMAMSPAFDGDTTSYRIPVGDKLLLLKPVSITATGAPGATITVDGEVVESGVPSVLTIDPENPRILIQVTNAGVYRAYLVNLAEGDPIISAKGAKAGSSYPGQNDSIQPVNTINGSGMSDGTLSATHDNNSGAITMWHTDHIPNVSSIDDAWIEYDLGAAYSLDQLWIWNMNQSNSTGWERGFKDVKIEYSLDGESWTALTPPEGMVFGSAGTDANYPFQFAISDGTDKHPATNLNDGDNTPVTFNGAQAQHVRISAKDSWGGNYFGLSEVRFTAAIAAKDPVPVTDITITGGDTIDALGGSLQFEATVEPEDATYQKVDWSVVDEAGEPSDIAAISADGKLHVLKNGEVTVVAAARDDSGVTAEHLMTISGQRVVYEGVTATAGDHFEPSQLPVNVTNNSGMSGTGSVFDTHDNNGNAQTMWHTNANPGEDAWIEFDLGEEKLVGEMWIWNINQSGNTDRGLRNVKIEYRAAEEDEWRELREDAAEGDYPYILKKAAGKPNMAATNLESGLPVVFNRDLRFVRMTANPVMDQGNYGSEYYGLSEVRFTEMAEGESQVYPVEGVSLDESSLSLLVGDTSKLTATLEPENATNTGVSWESDDESIATVTAEGVVKAVAEGSAVITVTTNDGGFTAECGVEVSTVPEPTVYTITVTQSENGTIAPETVQVAQGGERTFTITAASGYEIKSVLVDGKDVGAVATYSFKDVQDNHSIRAEFIKKSTPPPSGGGTSSPTRYTISVTQAEGGSITPTSASVKKGEDATFAIKADEGYQIKDVLVDGESVGAVSSYTFEKVTQRHRITAVFEAITEPEKKATDFADVQQGDWFVDAVQWALNEGIMKGASDSAFAPLDKTSRAMVLTMLYRQAGSPDATEGGTWYDDAAKWAAAKGVSDGSNLMAEITREQLVTMLWRVNDSPKAELSGLDTFADGQNVSDWAKEAVAWAVKKGILTGKGQNSLDPAGEATRAETATMFMRLAR